MFSLSVCTTQCGHCLISKVRIESVRVLFDKWLTFSFFFFSSFSYSQAAAASFAEPPEGVVQRVPCGHPAETAGERPADPAKPGRRPGAWLAPRLGRHRSHPQ